jgi:hypothetical protein
MLLILADQEAPESCITRYSETDHRKGEPVRSWKVVDHGRTAWDHMITPLKF